MKHRIAVVESDTRFATTLSRRLQRLLPSSSYMLYSPESLKENIEWVFSEEVVLYNHVQLERTELEKHINQKDPIPLITIREVDSPTEYLLDGQSLAARIHEALENSQKKESSSKRIVTQELRKSIAFFSFVPKVEREHYISQRLQWYLGKGSTPIRLDFMRGISLHSPVDQERMATHQPSYTGISGLLYAIEQENMTAEKIQDFMQMTPEGFWSFGAPLRSDDIICCQPIVLKKCIELICEFIDLSDEIPCGIFVFADLPFRTLSDLCPLFQEVHLLQSESQDEVNLYDFEYQSLLRKIPATGTPFIYHSRERITS